uniref:Uncharacterized protein n=1 Tax=Arundo donax TaxID=35708 RepID=A0A0A8YHN9_ARUDO
MASRSATHLAGAPAHRGEAVPPLPTRLLFSSSPTLGGSCGRSWWFSTRSRPPSPPSFPGSSPARPLAATLYLSVSRPRVTSAPPPWRILVARVWKPSRRRLRLPWWCLGGKLPSPGSPHGRLLTPLARRVARP